MKPSTDLLEPKKQNVHDCCITAFRYIQMNGGHQEHNRSDFVTMVISLCNWNMSVENILAVPKDNKLCNINNNGSVWHLTPAKKH